MSYPWKLYTSCIRSLTSKFWELVTFCNRNSGPKGWRVQSECLTIWHSSWYLLRTGESSQNLVVLRSLLSLTSSFMSIFNRLSQWTMVRRFFGTMTRNEKMVRKITIYKSCLLCKRGVLLSKWRYSVGSDDAEQR